MILGKLGLSFVIAGTFDYKDKELYKHLEEPNGVPPRFGRNWWYWKPVFKFNLLGKEPTVTRFRLIWLCFLFEIEWWK